MLFTINSDCVFLLTAAWRLIGGELLFLLHNLVMISSIMYSNCQMCEMVGDFGGQDKPARCQFSLV